VSSIPWEPIPDDLLVMVLVRHGRTAWNAERRFLGRTDLPLDGVGTLEAERLAAVARGQFDHVYVSPLRRARETALALAPPDGEAVDALQEMGHGEIEGLTGEEALARHAAFFDAFDEDPTDVRIPGGETFREVRDRAWAALQLLAAAHRPGERVAVVSHQVVISTVLCTLSGSSLRDWRRFGLPNTGAAVLGWRNGRATVQTVRWVAPERAGRP
jgi:broad specificity phosphatase PhoE